MKCPYCAEEIQDQAIVCRYCHRDLQFYQPLAARLDALEKKMTQLTAAVERLQVPQANALSNQTAGSATPATLSFYILALVLGAIVTAGTYAAFLESTGLPWLLWASILTPLFVGIWIGLVTHTNRSLSNLLVVGFGEGLLTSIGVTLVLIPYVAQHNLRIDWQAVITLYFLPSFFLITSGGFIGGWLRAKRSGESQVPTYARDAARTLLRTRTEGGTSDESLDHWSKFISSLAPLLTFAASIITALLSFIANTQGH